MRYRLACGWLALLVALPSALAAEDIDFYGDPLPVGAVARYGTSRLRHGDRVVAVLFSPDGRTLASASWDGTVRLWEAVTGRQLRKLTAPVNALAWSPDGKLLAAACRDGCIRLWDPKDGDERHQLKSHRGAAHSVAFSPDGKRLVSAGADRTIRLWDPAEGEERTTLEGHEGIVYAVAFSPDGKRLASASADRTVRLWDAAAGKLQHTLSGHKDHVFCVAFHPGGKAVVSVGGGVNSAGDTNLRVWDPFTGDRLLELEHRRGHNVSALAFTPDGKTAALGGGSGYVPCWDIATAKPYDLQVGIAGESILCVGFSPDGNTLAWGQYDGRVRLWDMGKRTERLVAPPQDAWSGMLSFSPDGKLLAAGPRESYRREGFRLWELATGYDFTSHLDARSSGRFSPDGNRLAAAGWQTGSILWDLSAARKHCTLEASQFIYDLAWSPDGKQVAAADYNGKGAVYLFDAASGKRVQTLRAKPEELANVRALRVAYSPDGKSLAAVISSGGSSILYMYMWDLIAGNPRWWYEHRKGSIDHLTFSADSKLLACWTSEHVLLWNVANGKETGRIPVQSIAPLAFAPDSQTLAYGNGLLINLWNVARRQDSGRLVGHAGPVTALAFAPDGKALASLGRDSTVLLWDLVRPTEKVKNSPPKLAPDELNQLWADLAGNDLVAGHRAVSLLAARPEQALLLIKEKVRPDATQARIRRLIVELDSDEFAVREKASEELKKLGRTAEKPLRQVLKGQTSVEVRRRIDLLLSALPPSHEPDPIVLLTGEPLRTVRAIQVLERVGTSQARAALGAITKELPLGSRELQAAQAALQRIGSVR